MCLQPAYDKRVIKRNVNQVELGYQKGALWYLASTAESYRKKKDPFLLAGGFLGDSDGKESASKAGDWGLMPGLGRSPEEGNVPTPGSLLENPLDRGAWRATESWLHGATESDVTE